ncbi:hypothetical protein AX15_001666 [Amanita polypyramis BW_CC]|nr:hypothetical protein AX15_001666 [Amanita polypyramis BW_CC]
MMSATTSYHSTTSLTTVDAGRQPLISILNDPLDYTANGYKFKGRPHWDAYRPSAEYYEHMRIKRISPAERRRADGLVKVPYWSAAARAQRQMKKLRKKHHDACMAQIKRESDKTRFARMWRARNYCQTREHMLQLFPDNLSYVPQLRVQEIVGTLWEEIVASKLRK